MRLGQLPGDQGKLADRTQELEEALAAVDSIVYIWANKDIVSSMTQVKDELGKPDTGVPTQQEQARIVEQLDAMIKNLEIKPLESKFAQKGGGGGGGGQCGPKLPSEAELERLSDQACAAQFRAYVGVAFQDPDLYFFGLPKESSRPGFVGGLAPALFVEALLFVFEDFPPVRTSPTLSRKRPAFSPPRPGIPETDLASKPAMTSLSGFARGSPIVPPSVMKVGSWT